MEPAAIVADLPSGVRVVAPVLWVPVPRSATVRATVYASVKTPLAFAATVSVLPAVAVTSAGVLSRSA